MSELEELQQRMDALEGRVDQLREDAVATRTLAGMADRDASEMRTVMRGHTQVLNSLRETQVEQGQKLEALDRTVRGIADAVGGLVTGQTAMAERQNKMDQRFASMAEQLQRIADRLDVGSAEA